MFQYGGVYCVYLFKYVFTKLQIRYKLAEAKVGKNILNVREMLSNHCRSEKTSTQVLIANILGTDHLIFRGGLGFF